MVFRRDSRERICRLKGDARAMFQTIKGKKIRLANEISLNSENNKESRKITKTAGCRDTRKITGSRSKHTG